MDFGTTKMIAKKEGGIGWMFFNQPEKRNAVSYEMWVAIPKIIESFENDPEVRGIVLTGAGDKAFVSGADISEFEKKRSSPEDVKIYNAAGAGDRCHLVVGKEGHRFYADDAWPRMLREIARDDRPKRRRSRSRL